MTREEAIAYCDQHLSRVTQAYPGFDNWSEVKGWGPRFDIALWFSMYGDYFYHGGMRYSKPLDAIVEEVQKFKRYILTWRLIGAESS